MKKYIILTDVNCDLNEEIRNRFGVKDYIHGHVHFSDNRDFETALDWNNISKEEFYKALSDRKMKITTAPASPEEYYGVFTKYAQEGYDILSISLSTQISSTYANSMNAAERVMAENPDCKIICCDSLRMSGSLGLITVYAHVLQNEGKTIEEVAEWIENNKRRCHQMGPIDDLMFVARRGRISTGKAIMGSFAGVKPMGDSNKDGYVTVLTKVKGIKKALNATVEYIRECATDIENQYVLIAHSNRDAYAEQLRELIENELHPKEILVTDVFSSCGTNIGPGMIGAYFLGDPISEDGEKEKEIMNKALERV